MTGFESRMDGSLVSEATSLPDLPQRLSKLNAIFPCFFGT